MRYNMGLFDNIGIGYPHMVEEWIVNDLHLFKNVYQIHDDDSISITSNQHIYINTPIPYQLNTVNGYLNFDKIKSFEHFPYKMKDVWISNSNLDDICNLNSTFDTLIITASNAKKFQLINRCNTINISGSKFDTLIVNNINSIAITDCIIENLIITDKDNYIFNDIHLSNNFIKHIEFHDCTIRNKLKIINNSYDNMRYNINKLRELNITYNLKRLKLD